MWWRVAEARKSSWRGECPAVASHVKTEGMFWVEGKASVKAMREERMCVANTAVVNRNCTRGPKSAAPIHFFLPQSLSGNHLEPLPIWPHGNPCDSWLPPQMVRVPVWFR